REQPDGRPARVKRPPRILVRPVRDDHLGARTPLDQGVQARCEVRESVDRRNDDAEFRLGHRAPSACRCPRASPTAHARLNEKMIGSARRAEPRLRPFELTCRRTRAVIRTATAGAPTAPTTLRATPKRAPR